MWLLSDVEVEEWIDAGDEVIAVLRLRTHGRQSGVPVDFHQAHVWTVKDSKLTRLRIFQSKAEALESLRPLRAPAPSRDELDHRDD